MLEVVVRLSPWSLVGIFVAALGGAILALYLVPAPLEVGLFLLTGVYELLLFGWLLAVGLYFNSRGGNGQLISPVWPIAALAFACGYLAIGAPHLFRGNPDTLPLLAACHLLAPIGPAIVQSRVRELAAQFEAV